MNAVIALADELFLNKTPGQPSPAVSLTGFMESKVLAESAHIGAFVLIKMRQQRLSLIHI